MTASTIAFSTPINEDRFTVKLHKLLHDAEIYGFYHIIGWNNDGRSFTIFKPEEFAKSIMKQYFRQSKYKSFQRQLNLYDFRREARNGFRGFYSHPMFIRNNRAMSNHIRRKGTKANQMAVSVPLKSSLQYPSKGFMLLPMFVASTCSSVNAIDLNKELAAILQPVPVNKDAMRCYSPKRDLLDNDESIGTIEGQILDEEDYYYNVNAQVPTTIEVQL